MVSANASSISSPMSVSMMTGCASCGAGAARVGGIAAQISNASFATTPCMAARVMGRSGQIDEPGDTQDGENIDEPITTPGPSAHELQDGVAGNAEGQAISDRIAQRNHDHGQKRGNGDPRI